jgi:hypothetical protein
MKKLSNTVNLVKFYNFLLSFIAEQDLDKIIQI